MRLLLVAVLLLLPTATAEHGGEHVLQYLAFVETHNSDTGEVPETSVTVAMPHTWQHVNGSSILEVRANYLVSSGASISPQADFQVFWNGTALQDCDWHVEGGTFTGGRFNPTISVYCELPSFAQAGQHTVEVRRTAVTGTPVQSSITSIVLHQRETVHMDIALGTSFDALIPVFWLAVVWFSVWRMGAAGPRYLGLLLFAILGFIDAALPEDVPGLGETALWGIALALFSVALINRFGTEKQDPRREP